MANNSAGPIGKSKKSQQALVLGRRESIYDTEGQAAGTIVNSINVFDNFKSFASAVALAKQFGRDTNLSGSNGALPKNYRFGAYRLRMLIRAYAVALTADSTILEEINRYRQLTAITVKTNRSEYMTAMADDLVSWADNRNIAVFNNADCLHIVPGTDHEGRVLEVSKQPFTLGELEQFDVEIDTPGNEAAVLFTLSEDIYDTVVFDGVLVRPVN